MTVTKVDESQIDNIEEELNDDTCCMEGKNYDKNCVKQLRNTEFYYMAGSASGEDKANPVF